MENFSKHAAHFCVIIAEIFVIDKVWQIYMNVECIVFAQFRSVIESV